MSDNKTSNSLSILFIEGELEGKKKVLQIFSGPAAKQYQIAQADDLKTAFEVLSQQTFDIVLLNLKLKDSEGLDTLIKIRPQLGTTPFIIINGPTDEEYCGHCLSNGAAEYFSSEEMKSESLLRAIKHTHQKSKWAGGATHLYEEVRAEKINALRVVTRDIVDDIHPSVEEIHSKMGALRDEILKTGEFPGEAGSLLDSAEATAQGLKETVHDLIGFNAELAQHCKKIGKEFKAYRILVVEDEPEVCDVIVKRLARLNEQKIDTARNGQEAFNMCLSSYKSGSPYHIVISDWKMPRMSGAELLGKLRGNPFYRNIPFMMISAVDDRNEIRQIATLNVSQYLLKPFTKEDFDKRFKRLLYHVYSGPISEKTI